MKDPSTTGNSFQVKHFAVGSAILILLVFFIKFLIWKYSTFYLSGYGAYKEWFPGKHAIIFPLVKAFPFAIAIPLLFIFRNAILNYVISWLDLVRIIISLLFKFSQRIFDFSLNGILSILTFIQKKLNWFSVHIKKKEFHIKTGLVFGALFFVLILCEIILRVADFKPSIIDSNPWFKEVDSLFETKGLISDSNGIFKVDPVFAELLRNELIVGYNGDSNSIRTVRKDENNEVFGVFTEFLILKNPGFYNDFKGYIKTLSEQHNGSLSDFQQSVLNYAEKPINDNGFRSIEFKKYEGNSTSILLLGDSFTWGHSASNLTNSFVDFLLTKGNIVYNAGVSGADPAQYLQLAKLYLPALCPDYVIVNLFLGNDVLHFKREIKPGRVVHFATNAGNLVNCPDGICWDNPDAAYKFTLSHIKIPPTRYFNNMCSLSSLGTVVWKGLWKKGFVENFDTEYESYYKKVNSIKTDFPYCNVELVEIKKIAEENGTKFIVIAIPELKEKRLVLPDEIPGLTKDIPLHVPNLTLKDYNSTDGHYNDEGHRKHAELIMKLIKESENWK